MGLLSGQVVERLGSRLVGIPNARVFLRREDGKLFTVMSGGSAGHGTSQGQYQVVLPAGRYGICRGRGIRTAETWQLIRHHRR